MIIKYFDLLTHLWFKIIFVLDKNISFGKNIHIKKAPIIKIGKKSFLNIGNNVTLNSKNSTYHVNMFAPVKIFSKVPGSIVIIGDNTRIHGACIHSHKKISIGKNCLIAANSQIFDSSGHTLSKKDRLKVSKEAKEIIIEDNVWIGTGVIILPGTVIKEGSVVSAGSVVRGTFEINSLIAGNPAKLIKKIDNE